MKKRNLSGKFEEEILSLVGDCSAGLEWGVDVDKDNFVSDLHQLVEKYTDLIRKEGLSSMAFSDDTEERLIDLQ